MMPVMPTLNWQGFWKKLPATDFPENGKWTVIWNVSAVLQLFNFFAPSNNLLV